MNGEINTVQARLQVLLYEHLVGWFFQKQQCGAEGWFACAPAWASSARLLASPLYRSHFPAGRHGP